DKLLPETVRLGFGPDTTSRRWHSVHAHRYFDQAALERVNARRGLVIGGGGLFIPDTMPNGNSAWQWNVPDEHLRAIDVPIMIYAVGFNAFDGQSYRATRFNESLRLLVEKSSFFGLRNHGSIAKVRGMLPPELQDKVVFQPCPTTVMRQLVPGWTDPSYREDTVMLNAAYDRAGLRFGHDYGHFLAQMARAVRRIGAHTEVKCVAHSLDDEKIAFDLRREHGISLPVIPMYDFSNDEIRETYAKTRLVIGMRGHAGMIPFGVGTPIVSLISHPKMAYFLNDIERPEWGVSVHERDLGDILTERAIGILDNHSRTVADVHDRQQQLWKVTEENAATIKKILGR
ncbi:polysaccharide pyruvyl transferase family protein, partial [Streptomyces sp. NPDC048279]|uniref:polysaccharide pyruvyl transferase family protein n=1 Tax=Streptomyces sp. NPDC048279 TaxID=3154714 RepID=UPI003421E770